MNRKEAIKTIEATYPADTHVMGRHLLEQARREIVGWRTEPTEVLVRYAELCIEEENKG